jgi:hypothetical protein
MSIFCASTERTGSTVVKVTFKNTKTKKSTAKKFRCVVKPATEQTPETPETPVVTEAVKVTAAAQKSGNTVEVTLSSAVTSAAVADFSITRDETSEVIPIDTVTIDSTDGTKVTITTYNDMIDAKAYTVTYTAKDDAKTQSTAQFTATDNVIDSLGVTPLTVVAGVSTTIKYQTIDKNGVVLSERSVKNTASDIEFTEVSNAGYFSTDGKLKLSNVGDTATITITYHTNKYDTTTGKEIGAIEKTATITAVEAKEAASVEYTIATTKPYNWATTKKSTVIGLTDTAYNAYIRILDGDGDAISDVEAAAYSVTSSNKSVLLASGTCDGAIDLSPVSEGTANLIVSKNGTDIYTLPINVGAARKLTSVTMSTSSVTVATGAATTSAGDEIFGQVNVVASAYDQYGVAYDITSEPLSVTCSSSNNTNGNVTAGAIKTTPVDNTVVVAVSPGAMGDNTKVGATTVTLTVGTGTSAKSASFRVNSVTGDTSQITNLETKIRAVVSKGTGLTALTTGSAIADKIDTTVKAKNVSTSASKEYIQVYGLYMSGDAVISGSALGSAKGITVSAISVVSNGKKYAEARRNATTGDVTCTASSSAINYTALKSALDAGGAEPLNILVREFDGSQKVTKYLPAGTYTVTYTITGSNKYTTLSTTFNVVDTQASTVVKVHDNALGTLSLDQAFALSSFATFTYDGQVLSSGDYNTTTIGKFFGVSSGNTATITNMFAGVPVDVTDSGVTTTYNVQTQISVNTSFTKNEGSSFGTITAKGTEALNY